MCVVYTLHRLDAAAANRWKAAADTSSICADFDSALVPSINTLNSRLCVYRCCPARKFFSRRASDSVTGKNKESRAVGYIPHKLTFRDMQSALARRRSSTYRLESRGVRKHDKPTVRKVNKSPRIRITIYNIINKSDKILTRCKTDMYSFLKARSKDIYSSYTEQNENRPCDRSKFVRTCI